MEDRHAHARAHTEPQAALFEGVTPSVLYTIFPRSRRLHWRDHAFFPAEEPNEEWAAKENVSSIAVVPGIGFKDGGGRLPLLAGWLSVVLLSFVASCRFSITILVCVLPCLLLVFLRVIVTL